jgi:hypothetical protein
MLQWFSKVHNVWASRYSLAASLVSHSMLASSVQLLCSLSLHDGFSADQTDKEVCFNTSSSATRQVDPSCVVLMLSNQIGHS